MRVILTLLLLGGWASAQVSYTDLLNKLKQNQDPQTIQEEIKTEGIDFQVDLAHLKMMKRDGFPNWLIDTLVYAQHRDAMAPAPRRYADEDYGNYPYDDHYYGRTSAHLFWDWAFGYPFWYSGVWSPYYYNYMNPYNMWSSWYWPGYGGYYWGDGYYNYWNDGIYLQGNRLRRDGYRNQVDDRVVGRARVKGSSKSTSSRGSRSSATSSRSSSGRSSAGSSSGRSSGGSVSSRGYSKGKN